MFYHMQLARKELHHYENNEFEIVVYRAEEDGHLRGYIFLSGFGDQIVGMHSETANDLQLTTGNDPVEVLMQTIKDEIDAGKFQLPNNS